MKIICHCLISGKHMTDVTHERVFLIYTLIQDDVDLNVGAVIFFCIEKALPLRVQI